MRKIGDDNEDDFVEEEKKKDKDGVIAVKDDPQFTLAITRGRFLVFDLEQQLQFGTGISIISID